MAFSHNVQNLHLSQPKDPTPNSRKKKKMKGRCTRRKLKPHQHVLSGVGRTPSQSVSVAVSVSREYAEGKKERGEKKKRDEGDLCVCVCVGGLNDVGMIPGLGEMACHGMDGRAVLNSTKLKSALALLGYLGGHGTLPSLFFSLFFPTQNETN